MNIPCSCGHAHCEQSLTFTIEDKKVFVLSSSYFSSKTHGFYLSEESTNKLKDFLEKGTK